MFNPYFLMSALFAALAILTAATSALTSFGLVPWFNGLRWLRVHFITLGILTEVLFGLLPLLVAARAGRPKPATRWDIWLGLNTGLLILLSGIPLMNGALIFAGGTLVFMATLWLIQHLRALGPVGLATPAAPSAGRKFYIAGLGYLLLGIIVGTGLWIGWGPALGMAVPIEVHIHANNWGFMSLVFAGLLVDFYPEWTGRPLATPRAITPIFWLLVVGAFGLVLGPWLKSELFTVPGILLYLSATLWLMLSLIKPLLGDRQLWTPGLWHLFTAQVWILSPVLVAPLILLKVPGFPGAGIEQSAPQALIYGWVLQFGYAFIPYVLARAFQPTSPAQLGGTWFSLTTVHLGSGLLWAGIFLPDYQAGLHGAAYVAWASSMWPLVSAVWRITRAGLARLEAQAPAT
jgi:hypothetical protein